MPTVRLGNNAIQKYGNAGTTAATDIPNTRDMKLNMSDTELDGTSRSSGGFTEINPGKIVVLAEEAIPMEEFDLAVLDQRIKDTEEDLIAAKSDAERARISESLDDLRLIRAAF